MQARTRRTGTVLGVLAWGAALVAQAASAPTAVPVSGVAGVTVFYFDAGGAEAAWAFGDGQTAHGPQAEHRFERPGTYRVGADDDAVEVVVHPKPRLAEAAEPGRVRAGEAVRLRAEAALPDSRLFRIEGIRWTVGDRVLEGAEAVWVPERAGRFRVRAEAEAVFAGGGGEERFVLSGPGTVVSVYGDAVYADGARPANAPDADGVSWETALKDVRRAVALARRLGIENVYVSSAPQEAIPEGDALLVVPTGVRVLGGLNPAKPLPEKGFRAEGEPRTPLVVKGVPARFPFAVVRLSARSGLAGFETVLPASGAGEVTGLAVVRADGAGVRDFVVDGAGAKGVPRRGIRVEDSIEFLAQGVEIRRCSAPDAGAGIRLVRSAVLEFRACAVEANVSGAEGGGMAAVDTSGVVVMNSRFSANQAASDGGAISFVYTPAYGQYVPVRVRRTLFEKNRATGYGGGLSVHGRGDACMFVVADGCLFRGNAARAGGAVALRKASAYVFGCAAHGNAAGLQGEALWVAQSRARVAFGTFVGNAQTKAATVWAESPGVDLYGCLVYSPTGLGVGSNGLRAAPVVKRSGVFRHRGAATRDIDPADPRFVDPGAGDYRLRPESPFYRAVPFDVNAWIREDPTVAVVLRGVDFRGVPRLSLPRLNAGAFEAGDPPDLPGSETGAVFP